MTLIGRLLSRLNTVSMGIGAVIVVMMVVHVSADVFMRYVFNSPLPGTLLFVAGFYMIAITFLPAGAVEEAEANISVEILYDQLWLPLQRLLRALSFVLSIVVFGMLAVRTWMEAMTKFETGSFALEAGIRIVTWPSYFVLPVAFALAALVFCYKLVCHVTGQAPTFAVPEGPRRAG